MLYESSDPVTKYLNQLGVSVETYYLRGTKIVLGGLLQHGISKIGYRFDEETTSVIVCHYESTQDIKNLKSALKDLLWFFNILALPELGIVEVKGHVSPGVDSSAGLEAERLKAFYKMIGANKLEVDHFGTEWMIGTPDGYRAIRSKQVI